MLVREYVEVLKNLSKMNYSPEYSYRKWAFYRAYAEIESNLDLDLEVQELSTFNNIKFVSTKILLVLSLIHYHEYEELKRLYGYDHTRRVTKENRIDIKSITPVVNYLAKELEMIPAGSFRRKSKYIGDLDFISVLPYDKLIDLIHTINVKQDDIRLYVTNAGTTMLRCLLRYEGIEINVDIKRVEPNQVGPALLHLTGNAQFNIYLRYRAKFRGWKLNEYGLFDKDGNRIDGNTELSIFEALDVDYVFPENRDF